MCVLFAIMPFPFTNMRILSMVKGAMMENKNDPSSLRALRFIGIFTIVSPPVLHDQVAEGSSDDSKQIRVCCNAGMLLSADNLEHVPHRLLCLDRWLPVCQRHRAPLGMPGLVRPAGLVKVFFWSGKLLDRKLNMWSIFVLKSFLFC